jgi:hypothetical protein
MKVKKAPEIDNITAEEPAASSQGSCLRILHRLCRLIWDNGQVPSEWKQSVIIPIHKKKDKLECSNYRGISLLCQCSKVFSSIILQRIKKKTDEVLKFYQKRRRVFETIEARTVDQIFTLRQLAEKYE